MAIDLSKLRALELPRKEIEVDILGDKQIMSVRALDDEAAIRISVIAQNKDIPAEDLPVKIQREVLSNGAPDLSADDVELLLKMAFPTVMEIATEIRDLTAEYGKKRNDAKEQAEKNLPAAEVSASN